MEKKKSFWRGLGIALLYILLFFAAQIIFSFAVSMIGAIILAKKDPSVLDSLDVEKLMGSEFFGAMELWGLIIGEAALILILFIFFWATKKNPFKKFEINPVSPLTVILSIITGFSINLFVGSVLDMLPIPQAMNDEYDTAFDAIYKTPAWLIILGIGIIGPICEEIIFRGGVMNALRREGNAPVAIILSGLVFGLVHLIPIQVMYAAFIGIVLGIIFHTTKSLIPTIIIHIVNNIISSYTAQLFGWTSKFLLLTVIVTGIITTVCVVLMAVIEKKRKYALAR